MDSANINTAEQNITQVKTALKAFVENEKIAKMLGKDFVSEMNDWEALIEKKSEEPFTLVILGEFKRGKSTIINALLGKELPSTFVCPVALPVDAHNLLEGYCASYGLDQAPEWLTELVAE